MGYVAGTAADREGNSHNRLDKVLLSMNHRRTKSHVARWLLPRRFLDPLNARHTFPGVNLRKNIRSIIVRVQLFLAMACTESADS